MGGGWVGTWMTVFVPVCGAAGPVFFVFVVVYFCLLQGLRVDAGI